MLLRGYLNQWPVCGAVSPAGVIYGSGNQGAEESPAATAPVIPGNDPNRPMKCALETLGLQL